MLQFPRKRRKSEVFHAEDKNYMLSTQVWALCW